MEISNLLSGLKTIGLLESENELRGVRTKASTSGDTIGPPAAAEYAVEPVGVATIRPSALSLQSGSELRFTESIIVETPRSAEITASFKLKDEYTFFPSRKTSILSMERFVEIPKSINRVLEFTNGKVSFCGNRDDYEALLQERKAAEADKNEEERKSFREELSQIHNDSTFSKANGANNDDENLIEFHNVNVGWGETKVIRNLDWTVKKGEHWLVRGPNGSGKTTILELITGDNQQVYCNDIWLFGRKRGTGESIWDIKAKLGIVSYRLHVDYRMIGGFDLESVIISGFHDSIGLYEAKTDIEKQAAKKWLKLGGFEGRENDAFSSLSYGEQRAILILRAAVKQPPVLILDEPCHGLDENYRQKILDLMEVIAESGTTTILHVTHDPTEVLKAEKHILELHPNEEPMYRILKSED